MSYEILFSTDFYATKYKRPAFIYTCVCGKDQEEGTCICGHYNGEAQCTDCDSCLELMHNNRELIIYYGH